jgi:hypothetical protein
MFRTFSSAGAEALAATAGASSFLPQAASTKVETNAVQMYFFIIENLRQE